ncbi:MAG: Activator of Hsp90 ATPase 1 family protein [Candidatus Saccharibacteria bacterium]|nr:Activator of Hsp90 ATPase 1 family protein [Candidatus Saccharibacteria bacterium]
MSDTTITATPGGYEVVIKREFNATKDKVFEAYNDPELFVQWIGPSALTTKIDSWDAVPGGKWRYVSKDSDGNEYGFHGYYHDIVENERIVQTFEFEGMPGRASLNAVKFEENNGKTMVTSVAVFENQEDRDGMLSSGMERGVNQGYDRLTALLEK